MSTNWWMDKDVAACTQTEYYSAIGNLAICDNMGGPWGHNAKKSDRKDKDCMILLICGIFT